MSQLFFWFNPKLSEAAAWNPTKKSRGSSPPNLRLGGRIHGVAPGDAGHTFRCRGRSKREASGEANHFFTGLRRRYFTMVIQCINNYGGKYICKYDSYNYCIQTMNEQCRIEYCKIMKPW